MIYVEILAGGNGTRMGNTKLPKQFLMLGNKPIIIYSIEQFLKNKRVDKIIITCIPTHIDYLKQLLNEYIEDQSIIEIVKGGKNRDESVMNGCNYILNKYGLDDSDVIIVHDSVRPFIDQRIINDNIDMVLNHGAVGTAIPATDTVFITDNDNIKEIPLRDNMFLAQSPQSFNIKKLMTLYSKLSSEEKDIMTDSCKIFTLNKEYVKLVLGDLSNIKITTKHDLEVAQKILVVKNSN